MSASIRRWEATLYEYDDDYEIEAGHTPADSSAAGEARNGWFYEAALDEARERVIEAVREMLSEPLTTVWVTDALAALDALEAQDDTGAGT